MTVPETPDKPSTRYHVVDHRFAAILSEDFRIETCVILDALEGEPKKAAIAVCAWAVEKTDDPVFALTSWAKKHGKGRCRRATHPAQQPARRHGAPRDDRRDAARPSDTPRRRGGSYGLDPARVRANLEGMGG